MLLRFGVVALLAAIAASVHANPEALYHNYCSVCHGDRGDGRSRARASLVPPPRDFTEPRAASELTRESMIAITRDGKRGTAMVGWKTQLREAEIESVVDYIRATFMQPERNASLARGRALYAGSCAVCHGERGQGAIWAGGNMVRAPRAFASPAARAELSRERMIDAVVKGRPGTAMPSFATQLPRPDIDAVVDYIRADFMRAPVSGISGTSAHAGRTPGPVAAADMSLPLPKRLKGGVGRGERFYAANCATCHGARGDGRGPRAYFINPKPRNFVDPSARALLNRPALFAAIAAGKPGTEMPAWDKVIDDQQIADVAEYVFRAFVRPEQGAGAKRKP